MPHARRPNGYPKLTPEQESLVFAAYSAPGMRVREIADLFKVSRQTVYNIVSRKRAQLAAQAATTTEKTDRHE